MQIILIRHGQSKGNSTNTVQGHLDEGLSKLGEKQPRELSEHFKVGDLNAIYSSDLGRAFQTAEPMAQKLGLAIETEQDLREADFGLWEGLTYNEVKEKYPTEYFAWHKNYYIRPPWFESFDSHSKRIRRSMEKILKKHNLSDSIAVLTHGGSIKTQIGYFNKLNGEELAGFTNSNCSLTLIKFNPLKEYDHGKLIYYNKCVINSLAQKES